jgi:hypothetical protein
MQVRIRSYATAGAILTAIALVNVQTLVAQTEPAPKPKWSVVTVTTIKPEMRTEYEAWQKQMSAAFKKAEIPSRAVLQTIMGNLLEYVAVAPLAHFADLDGPSPIERAFGKDEAAVFMRKGAAYVTAVQRMASLALDDMSIQTETPEPAPYAVVTIMHVVPGKGPDFAAWMKSEYMPAMKKAEVKNFWVNQTVFGGDPNERVTVRPLNTMSEIDAGPIARKALGEEGARKLMSKTAGMIDSTRFSIVRYRPDLSYRTAPAAKSASAK